MLSKAANINQKSANMKCTSKNDLKKLKEVRIISFLTTMKVVYSHKFKYDTEFEKRIAEREWGQSLSCLSDDQVEKSFLYFKETKVWPPSIAEFKRKSLGLIDKDLAFKMAIKRDFSNKEVERAYKKIGSYDFRNKTEKDLRSLFNNYYEEECCQTLIGEETVDKCNRLCDNTNKLYIQ